MGTSSGTGIALKSPMRSADTTLPAGSVPCTCPICTSGSALPWNGLLTLDAPYISHIHACHQMQHSNILNHAVNPHRPTPVHSQQLRLQNLASRSLHISGALKARDLTGERALTAGSSRSAFAERMLSRRLLICPPVLVAVNSAPSATLQSTCGALNPSAQMHADIISEGHTTAGHRSGPGFPSLHGIVKKQGMQVDGI